ncbi:DUF4362 domain-containing protein [Paenibacillus mendelii]|uniref:DUF4362 domain-containing protein n=1 Tax=Paenibacillus mendelii TaxID=206163 RepID=A0ABV6JFZ2_9BACL|nr:DUF4362 domain-containing protein [Paenibacillus mendelii]MCQ6557705.1 DUF4362 domain-containing protein [Paenibacillus mendelii]
MNIKWKALIVASLVGLLMGCGSKEGGKVEGGASPTEPPIPSLTVDGVAVPYIGGGFSWTTEHGTSMTDAAPVREGLEKVKAAKAAPGAVLNITFSYPPQKLIVLQSEGEGGAIQVPVEQDAITLPSEAGVYMIELNAEWKEGHASYGTKIEITEPSTDKMGKPGEVIDMHGNVENIELLDSFIAGDLEQLRITHYTIEGDPIYHDLTASQEGIALRYDTTEDKFGTPKVYNYSCGRLDRSETDTSLTYTLKNCTGEYKDIVVLDIDYDLTKQDYFAFELQYGVGEKNIIDTIQGRLVKDLQSGEVTEVSDFKLGPDQMQAIYKQLKLSNFLGEKKLSNACNKDPHVSYQLQVKINGGARDFSWSECDDSRHGAQMTKIAGEMIALTTSTDLYKRLPDTKGAHD